MPLPDAPPVLLETHAMLRAPMLVLATLLPFIAASTVHAATYWVAPCGNDAWAGLSSSCAAPLGPKRTVQAALAVANPGDEIKVYPGVYTGQFDFDGKEIALLSLGGAAVTILDGAGAGPVVLCNSGEGPGTSITGFTIRNGYTEHMDGPGMVVALATVAVADCIFESNESEFGSGGGIAAASSAITVTGCTFTNNVAWHAGGMSVVGGSAHISDCAFIDNIGLNSGGGMGIILSNDVTIIDSVFTGGQVGGLFSAGGGLYIEAATVLMQGCAIDDNESFRGPAGIAMQESSLSLVNCSVSGNSMVNRWAPGGGIWALDSTLAMVGCSLAGNEAGNGGGAVYASGSTVTATWCGFIDNEAIDEWTIGEGGAVQVVSGTFDASLCTFTNNRSGSWGGGAVRVQGTDATFEGCTFDSNASLHGGAGGAIRARFGTISLDTCTLASNTAEAGGALDLLETQLATATACSFESNVAGGGDGGAIRATESTLLLTEPTLTGNASSGYGGGIRFSGPLETLEIVDGFFSSNTAAVTGGAMSSASPTTIVRTRFRSNASQDGGALALVGPFGDAELVSCRLNGNSATGTGGALFVGAASSGASATLVNCIVDHNLAPAGGGAILESALGGHVELVNSAVVHNDGGGLRIDNGASQSRISNSIIRSNIGGTQLGGVLPVVRFSNIQGGMPGTGNIDEDPMFTNPAGGNYALAAGSPCIDAGFNWAVVRDDIDLDADGDTVELVPLDYAGEPRFADDAKSADTGCGGEVLVDIGPHEHAGASVDGVRTGDLNTDGTVGVADLLILLASWGPCLDDCCVADIDLDGQVGVTDLLVILAAWN